MNSAPHPSNVTKFERTMLRLIGKWCDVPVVIGQLWNPETCPEPMLKYLAWALSVDIWDPTWPEAIRRSVLRSALGVHRWKGTRYSLEELLKSSGYGGAIVTEAKDLPRIGDAPVLGTTWRLGVSGAHWADFWVEVMQPITRREANRLFTLIKSVQPEHCRLTSIVVRDVQFTIGDNLWHLGEEIALGASYFLETSNA